MRVEALAQKNKLPQFFICHYIYFLLKLGLNFFCKCSCFCVFFHSQKSISWDYVKGTPGFLCSQKICLISRVSIFLSFHQFTVKCYTTFCKNWIQHLKFVEVFLGNFNFSLVSKCYHYWSRLG